MTKYCVSEHTGNGWESIALFADTVPLRAIIEFAKEHMKACYDLIMKEGYDIEPRDNVQVSIIGTGEILYNWEIDHMTVREALEDGAHIVNDEVMYPPSAWADDLPEDWEPSYHSEWDHWDDNSPWIEDYWDDGCPIEDYEPADIDSDMGFDPYLGCFTDDC